MTSSQPGTATSAEVEVVQISTHGVWLWVKGREFFLSHETFPWFLQATVRQVHNVVLLYDHHLRWPDLDVDLELEAIEHPERYPLRYQP
ncbi:MAG: DUF2442 domain-containing protein [Deltaproteobacteria bacterium]|nr:DUF2442 domain-containing protein [Deltaproteobacteria bacterium]